MRGGAGSGGMREVAVLGAGAVGSVVGAHLARAGRDVVLVGRGEHVDALRDGGLLLRTREGGRTREERVAVDAARELEPAEVVLVTVKTPDVPEAVAQVREASPDAVVVTCQNGVRADGMAAEVLERDAVVGAVTVFDAEFLEPGVVTLNRLGPLVVGDPWGRGVREPVEHVVGLLEGAHPVEARGDLRGARWTKLLVNLNNALPAATGRSVQEVVDHPGLARVTVRTLREGVRVVRAGERPLDPIPWTRPWLLRSLAWVPVPVAARVTRWKVHRALGEAPARPSTLQSVVRGGAGEVRFLNGEVVRLGEEVGVATPVNRALVEAVEEVHGGGRFLEPREVLERVDRG